MTIFEYLFLLREATVAVNPAGPSAMLYLSAAVSDFYIPEADMATDKIQSSADGLSIQLKNVPKMLSLVKGEWAPEVFLVSFKLETNENILQAKAVGAIQKYAVDAVCANNLLTYKDEVTIIQCKPGTLPAEVVVHAESISGDETVPIGVDGIDTDRLLRDPAAEDIESVMIPRLAAKHAQFIQAAGKGAAL